MKYQFYPLSDGTFQLEFEFEEVSTYIIISEVDLLKLIHDLQHVHTQWLTYNTDYQDN